MTELLIAAVLLLKTGATIPCERITIEVGQVACFNQCTPRERVCPGDEPIRCDQIDIVHPSYVQEIKLP